ncbi:MAG: Holliday junction branch migration protein RuvA [Acidobacteria bacterium]|nr:Holliday junction branch migration protein RuvA [Acidobacteriota bacterium]
MIAFLRGTVLEKHPNQVIVDTQGVGYDVTIPVSTYTTLGAAGSPVSLRIYTHVREDTLQLFGFATSEEKSLFEKLIGVTGVGPKLATTILSGLSAPDLAAAIKGGQVDRLVRIPGIGKKTAERLVLELREKVDTLAPSAPASTGPAPAATVLTAADQDVVSALVNLGAQRAQAEAAIRKARAAVSGDDFEVLFRKAMELLR